MRVRDGDLVEDSDMPSTGDASNCQGTKPRQTDAAAPEQPVDRLVHLFAYSVTSRRAKGVGGT